MSEYHQSQELAVAGAQQQALTTADRGRQWRTLKDKMAAFTITGGGLGVLAAILLIFFYLLYEVMPLFQSAEIERQEIYSLEQSGEGDALFLAMEEQAEIAFRLTSSGDANFFRVADGRSLVTQTLPINSPITAFALDNIQNHQFAVGAENGSLLLAKHEYKVSYPKGERLITPRVVYPFGEKPLQLTDGAALQSIAIRDTESALVVVGVAAGEIYGRRWNKEEDFLSGEVVLEEEELSLPTIDVVPQTLLIGPDQRWLYVVSRKSDYRVIDLRSMELAASGRLFEAGEVTDARFLLGGISLMAASSEGEIGQWFMVRESGKAPRLQRIRGFQHGASPIVQIASEHRRKGFVAVDAEQTLDIYHSTSERHLLSESMGDQPIRQIAISPRADALLVEHQNGEFSHWLLHNEHPEVSWSALWNEVWYESYSEPDYIWQSSASNNDFEPKYSFTPLAFGTLKAAFYAMIIAAPLAICGAIFTAYFMAPAMRRKIKPLIELMEALPTVILGFLAGLWLAPFIERNLPAVFSIFLLLPFGVLLFAYLWSRLPVLVRKVVPEGYEAALLIPVIIGLVLLCVGMSAPMERWFFEGDMRAWLTHDLGVSFDQRNALVVGVAMGFAVIPTIFSIAEDAIFSVPKHLSYGSLALGATPWQTLVGVVIPTASPGIFSALMIGMGRAVGETMIVLMATGNTPVMDANIFEGMRTLAANIAVEIGETEVDSSHYRVLFLAAFVLFMFTFVVNTVAEVVRQRLRHRYGSL